MSTTTATTERTTVPPIACRPWCVYGDGHPNETFREDQWCSSEERSIPVSHYPAVEWADEEYRPEMVTVYATEHESDAATINVSLGDTDALRLSAAEARALAAALLELVDTTELEGGSR